MASNRLNHAENFQYQTKHSPVKSDTSHRDESTRQVNSFFPHCDKCRIHSTLPSRIKNDSNSNKTERRIITFGTNQRSYTLLFQSLCRFLLSLTFHWGYEILHAVYTRLTVIPKQNVLFMQDIPHGCCVTAASPEKLLSAYRLIQCVPKLCCSRTPFWLRKTITDPHIFAHVNTVCPGDRYPKLKICTSKLILDSYEHIQVARVTMHSVI